MTQAIGVHSTSDRAAEHRRGDDRLAAWRAFLEAHARVSRRLDDELRAAHGISLAEYDALVQLVETPEQRLRMNQLAERVLLSRSGVTRLIDRLVGKGYVSRGHHPTDRRRIVVTLIEDSVTNSRRGFGVPNPVVMSQPVLTGQFGRSRPAILSVPDRQVWPFSL